MRPTSRPSPPRSGFLGSSRTAAASSPRRAGTPRRGSSARIGIAKPHHKQPALRVAGDHRRDRQGTLRQRASDVDSVRGAIGEAVKRAIMRSRSRAESQREQARDRQAAVTGNGCVEHRAASRPADHEGESSLASSAGMVRLSGGTALGGSGSGSAARCGAHRRRADPCWGKKSEAICPSAPMPSQASLKRGTRFHLAQGDHLGARRLEQAAQLAGWRRG